MKLTIPAATFIGALFVAFIATAFVLAVNV